MAPPKRGLFSLNLTSDVEHQHISDKSDSAIPGVRVFDTSERKSSDIGNAFGHLVNRTVDGVLEEKGKKVHRAEGELYTSKTTETREDRTTTETYSSSNRGSTLAVKSRAKRRALERKFDTSEL